MLETEYSEIDMQCKNCPARWEAPVAQVVNVKTHPDARLGILLGTMHKPRCPVCRTIHEHGAIFDYYDPDQQLVIQVRPDWEIHAGGGEDWYWARYEDLVQKYAKVDVRVDVVFGFEEMIEKFLGGVPAVEAARQEWADRMKRLEAEAQQRQAAEDPNGARTDASASSEQVDRNA